MPTEDSYGFLIQALLALATTIGAVIIVGDRLWRRKGEPDTAVAEELTSLGASVTSLQLVQSNESRAIATAMEGLKKELWAIGKSLDRDRTETNKALDALGHRMDHLDHHIRGNGHEGILSRLGRVEEQMKNIQNDLNQLTRERKPT